MDRNRAVNILNFVIFLFVPNYVSDGKVEIFSWPLLTLVNQGVVHHILLIDLIPYILFSVVLLIGIFVSVPSNITFQYYIRVIIINVVSIILLMAYHYMVIFPDISLFDISIFTLKYYYFGLFLILILNIINIFYHLFTTKKLK